MTAPSTLTRRRRRTSQHLVNRSQMAHYRISTETFFERSPIAYWVEDFSALATWLDTLRSKGVEDIRSHLQSNPDQVWSAIELIRIVDVNPAALRLIGATDKDQVLREGLGIMSSDESLSTYEEQIVAVWEGRSSLRTVGVGRSVDGERLEYILTWVVTANGKPRTVVVSLEDITELNGAQRRAEHLADVKDRFIGSITHELRTPLTGVLGFSELLSERNQQTQDAEIAEYTDLLSSAASAGAAILDNLLLAMELDGAHDRFASPIHLAPTSVDLVAETESAIATLPPDARSQIEIIGTPARAFGDSARVRQIIRNLLANAVRHGGPRIRVMSQNSGPTAQISVIDDGPGITGPEVAMAFGRYGRTRLDPGLPESLGVGLTVSRALALAMDGDLHYERNSDATSFSLVLPAAGTHYQR